MTLEQRPTSGAYEKPPLSSSQKQETEPALSPDEKIFNHLRKIIPKLPGFQTAIRSSANKGLNPGIFNFDIRHPVGNYSFHAVLEDGGKNGNRKSKLTAELSFSWSEAFVDGKVVPEGPVITERVILSPEDRSERKYHWGISDDSKEPTDLEGDKALSKIEGFVVILNSLTKK